MPPDEPAIPVPGPHGGDGPQVAAALGLDPRDVLDLSATLNPLAGPVATVLRSHLAAGALEHYPDPRPATAALAAAMGVDPAHLLLTNGGAEAIALVAGELGGHVNRAEFSLYPGGPGGPEWRSDPHSPSGVLAEPDEQAGVWDEAFYPLATGRWTAPGRHEQAVVVGSLTKLLACPGLRVGYVLTADEDLLSRVQRRQPEWSVNGLVTHALADLLATVDLARWVPELARLRAELVQTLAERGLLVISAAAPWVLVAEAPSLRSRLARHGIVVRDCTSFGLPGTMRLAVPDDAGRARLADALDRSDPSVPFPPPSARTENP